MVAAPNDDGNSRFFTSGFSSNQLVRSSTWLACDVALQPAAAPAPDDRRGLAGADRGLDLRLVGVVLELGVGDLALATRALNALTEPSRMPCCGCPDRNQ